jgi:hypothetical protein
MAVRRKNVVYKSAAIRAARSVGLTRKKIRRANPGMSRESALERLKSTGRTVRQSRISKGLDPNTGKASRTTRRGMAAGMASEPKARGTTAPRPGPSRARGTSAGRMGTSTTARATPKPKAFSPHDIGAPVKANPVKVRAAMPKAKTAAATKAWSPHDIGAPVKPAPRAPRAAGGFESYSVGGKAYKPPKATSSGAAWSPHDIGGYSPPKKKR